MSVALRSAYYRASAGPGLCGRFSDRGAALWLSALLLLLVLDAARSAVGHLGCLAPVSVWRPDPQAYADMSWPPARNVPTGATPAQRLYVENCAFCHGPDGRGNGSAPSMIPRPRDFTQGLFKYKSTSEGAPPSDDDLIAVVTNGLNASGMPYFRETLSEQEISRDVVGVVKGFSKAFPAAPTTPITLGPRPKSTPESLARGADLYKANCALCHGGDLRGGQWLKDSKGYPVVSRDLTAPGRSAAATRPSKSSSGFRPASRRHRCRPSFRSRRCLPRCKRIKGPVSRMKLPTAQVQSQIES